MGHLTGRRILIVDDEPSLREIMKDELEIEGAEVLEAEGGRTAYEMTRQSTLDAIVTDIRMPEGDGIELLEKVRSDQPSLPVVTLITAHSDLNPAEAYHRGASAIFAKPIDFDALLKTLARLIQRPDLRWRSRPERVPCDFKVTLQFPSADSATQTRTLNIGNGGFFLRIEGPLPRVGEVISFQISFEMRELATLEGTATVRWLREKATNGLARGFGAEFAEFTPAALRDLQELLAKIRPTPYIPRG